MESRDEPGLLILAGGLFVFGFLVGIGFGIWLARDHVASSTSNPQNTIAITIKSPEGDILCEFHRSGGNLVCREMK